MADELVEFLESLKDLPDQTGMVRILIDETIKYRDELKAETGTTLTVADARLALDALEDHLRERPSEVQLTEAQGILLKRWLNRITDLQKRAEDSEDNRGNR